MVCSGHIDKNQETEAAGVDMASQPQDRYEGKVSDYRYPSYFDAVVNEAVSSTILQKKRLSTTATESTHRALDQNHQANMQVIYENTSLFPTAEDGTHESGSVALEPKTGGVRGVVGRSW